MTSAFHKDSFMHEEDFSHTSVINELLLVCSTLGSIETVEINNNLDSDNLGNKSQSQVQSTGK